MAGPGANLMGREEREAVLEVLESGYLFRYGDPGSGKFLGKVWELERLFAERCNARHAVAVNSGTSALLTAFAALGIGPGDEVIVPGYTFIATITSVVFMRAVPVLAEVDATLNLDPDDVRAKITPRTRAIVLVHMLGNPGRIDEIRRIAEERHLYLVEDCAQALGASYKGRPVGSHGQAGTFSFNFFKTITAGEGGAVVMSDETLYKRAFAFHDQGHLPLRQGVEEGNRTVMGLDLRMTELAAAVIIAQMGKLDAIRARARANKKRLKAAISGIAGVTFRELPDPDGDLGTLLVFFLPDEKTTALVCKDLGCKDLSQSGWHVYSNMEHFLEKKTLTGEGCPFTCPHYNAQPMTYRKGMLPKTDALLKRAVNVSVGILDKGLGSSFGLAITSTDDEVERTAEKLAAVLRARLA